MYSMILTASAGVVATALFATQPAAAQGRWELLGTRSVGFMVDREVVSARGQGRFQVIRLCVQNNAVQFRDVEVVFANGQRQNLPVNSFVRPGACSADLELAGEARRIDHVNLVYNSVPNFRGQAVVQVYGLHGMRRGEAATGPGRQPGTWDEIGRRDVSFDVESDSISGIGEGRFRAVRLCVQRFGVRFRDVVVVYRNGEQQTLPVRRFVRPGECTPSFDLPGESRRIQEVQMTYNTARNAEGRASVRLFGMR